MRYVVDVTQNQANRITELITAGKYRSVAQFISAAIENQIYLENNPDNALPRINTEDKFSGVIMEKYNVEVSTQEDTSIALKNIKDKPQTVSLPEFSDLAISSYFNTEEEKCWLWGQSNKIFPIKIGLRVLYSLLGSGQWTDLEGYREKAAVIAASFGTKIRSYENKKDKIRDDRISAGLPKEKEFKSINRYKNHFLAYMRKDGKFDGPMSFLRFVNLSKDEKGKVLAGLTEHGINFAKIENPVIDGGDFERSFSDKEIDFYLNHIAKNVKGEYFAFRWVLNRIKNGVDGRGSINKALAEEMESAWEGVTPAVVNTQRAGLMARMFELGLIEKKKSGITVTYKISERGESFLKKIS